MRLIYLAHPWRSDPAGNAVALRRICAEVMAAGDIPIAPPLYFSWLDEAVPGDREAGMAAALAWLVRCDEVRVYAPATAGMQVEIDTALREGILVTWRARGEAC